MQRTTKKTVLFLAGFAALLLVFTFTDLAISKAIFNIQSPFGIFFAAFGETPCMLVACFSCAALVATRPQGKKAVSVLNLVLFGLFAAMWGVLAGLMPANYISLPLPVSILLGVAFVVACFFLAFRIPEAQRATLRKVATVGILLCLGAMVIINIIKIFWGRPRMRIMDDPDSQFTLWFLPQGIAESDQYKSFPSGHSANAACILWITLLPAFLPKLRTKRAFLVLNVVAYGWAALVMLSRVIMGAHFATDVTMGASITVCLFYLLRRAFVKPVELQ